MGDTLPLLLSYYTHVKIVDGLLVDDAEIDESELASITYGNVKEEPVAANELKDFTFDFFRKADKAVSSRNIFPLSLYTGTITVRS